MTTTVCDLLVIGSGPAGMSAAINGASEGLKVCMIDSNNYLGGQARESNAIENYPGFPEGITGQNLMDRFTEQAAKFGTRVDCPVRAVELREDGATKIVTTEDYAEYHAKTVLLSLGLSYRRLNAENVGKFMGRGVYYGLPVGSILGQRRKCRVVVIGGANSAGQAVLKLAQNRNAEITMLIRRRIVDQMSAYLIERIKQLSNVEVLEGAEMQGCLGDNKGLSHVVLKDGSEICTDSVHIFIGAVPRTMWLRDALSMDDKKFVQTWHDVPEHHLEGRETLPFETSMQGVFAAGDVRVGSVKRIASAIGEGGAALQMIHNRLASYE